MSELHETPEKQFFRTTEVCQLTDTQPYVLRFWESEFPQLAPEHGRGGQPLYRRRDVEIVLRIKQLLYDQEFTIEGARRQLALELSDGVDAPPATASAGTIPGGTASPEESGRIAELDPVPRQRYDDAIEEIELLRLKLRESEATQRKAELRAQRAEEAADRERQRSRAAAGRLEALLTALEAADSA